MKRFLPIFFTALVLSGCELWNVNPQPFPVWTAIPTRTPGIVSPTPFILVPSMTASPIVTSTDSQLAATDTPTNGPGPQPTGTPAPRKAVEIEILGCNTGLDITHGMGEVTNAYIILKNTGTEDLPNACALLRAADEEREHPDKEQCVSNLPAGYRVTFKLTVDSAFQEDTIIQVDASSDSTLMLRVDKQSCRDLDVAGLGMPVDIGVIKPINP